MRVLGEEDDALYKTYGAEMSIRQILRCNKDDE